MPTVEIDAKQMSEPDITINGVALSVGQAMALRVAASNFLMELGDSESLGPDSLGRELLDGYKARLREILSLMHESDLPKDKHGIPIEF